jgi:hypothetical protein
MLRIGIVVSPKMALTVRAPLESAPPAVPWMPPALACSS